MIINKVFSYVKTNAYKSSFKHIMYPGQVFIILLSGFFYITLSLYYKEEYNERFI